GTSDAAHALPALPALEAREVVAEELLLVLAREAAREPLLGEVGGELGSVGGELLAGLLQALRDLDARRLGDARALALGPGDDLLALALALALGARGDLVDLATKLGDLRRETSLHGGGLFALARRLGERMGELALLVLQEADERRPRQVGEEAEEDEEVEGE